MLIRVGLENGIEGHSLAWALDFPGCFADGQDGATALLNIPTALLQHDGWHRRHTATPWFQLGDFDIRLVETWPVYFVNVNLEEVTERDKNGYEVNAWFRDDWRPLNQVEVDHALQMLAWSRAAC